MRGRLLVFVVTLAASAAALPGANGATTAPSAQAFAHQFLTLSNAYARSQGYRSRVVHPDCVQAAPGRYMCAYATSMPGTAEQCRLMQARWTPNAASPITITLAGRVRACGSLREALRSLR